MHVRLTPPGHGQTAKREPQQGNRHGLRRTRRSARAERCVEWAREHGTPEQLAEAHAIADQWRTYRNQI
ncbi:MAG: hypothetical protein ACRDYA_20845 [Egibacteraceae bacterium]